MCSVRFVPLPTDPINLLQFCNFTTQLPFVCKHWRKVVNFALEADIKKLQEKEEFRKYVTVALNSLKELQHNYFHVCESLHSLLAKDLKLFNPECAAEIRKQFRGSLSILRIYEIGDEIFHLQRVRLLWQR